MSYASDQIRAQLERGPAEGENFYRLQVTGNGATKHINVSPEVLHHIAAFFEGAPNLSEAAADVVEMWRAGPSMYDVAEFEAAMDALAQATPPKPQPPIPYDPDIHPF
jgi:hypothetical protein